MNRSRLQIARLLGGMLLTGVVVGCGELSDAQGGSNLDVSPSGLSDVAPRQRLAPPSGSPSPYFAPTTPTRVSTTQAGVSSNGDSGLPSLSQDGSRVAFRSSANNLFAGAGDPVNPLPNSWGESDNGITKRFDVFVKDLRSGQLDWASRQSGAGSSDRESTYPLLSADGTLVAFRSWSNLVPSLYSPPASGRKAHVYLRNLSTDATTMLDVTSGNAVGSAYSALHSFTGGRYVSFSTSSPELDSSDGNGVADIYKKDVVTGALTRMTSSTATAGARNSWLDAGATRLVSVWSGSFGGAWSVNLYHHDLSAGVTRLVAGGLDLATNFEADGPVLFNSQAFFHRQGGVWKLDFNSLASSQVVANADSAFAVSGSGRYLVFATTATLVASDTNPESDIYVKDLQTGTVRLVSAPEPGRRHRNPTISGDGSTIAWVYRDTNVTVGRKDEIYLRRNPFF